MALRYLKISDLSNNEGNEMFNAICVNALRREIYEVRNELGLPVAKRVTTKDLVTLIQVKNIKCELTVIYDDNPPVEKGEDDPLF